MKICTALTADFIHGAVELEATDRGLMPHRLTSSSRRQVNGPVDPKVFSDPSGVRVRMHTAAQKLALSVWPVKIITPGRPAGPAPVYDIWCNGALHAQLTAEGGTVVTVNSGTGQQISTRETQPARIEVGGLPAGEKLVEIWLPYEEWTELISIESDQPVSPAPYPAGGLRWLHHGSSISHGAVAVGASHAWPAVAAAKLAQHRPVDLLNLGFAGNAKLDPFTARTIAETPADLISLKLGINVVNADSHTLRSFTPAVHGFLDIIREGLHAHTPLIVVTPLWCGIHELSPGPLETFDVAGPQGLRTVHRAAGSPAEVDRGRLNLETLRAELERIVALRSSDDPHLHFLSGLRLYDERDTADYPLPDDLHPDTAGHHLIGQRFAAELLRAGILPPAAG